MAHPSHHDRPDHSPPGQIWHMSWGKDVGNIHDDWIQGNLVSLVSEKSMSEDGMKTHQALFVCLMLKSIVLFFFFPANIY